MNLKSTLLAALAAVAISVPSALAQAVIFPQAQQPGVSVLTSTAGSWTLSNDILSASFHAEGGTLIFDGCEAMGLLPGTELFFVETRDGGVIPASRMTMSDVTTEVLAANPSSPRGAERFAGNALCATFRSGDLTIAWRAILRDGSHYLRTEMTLTSDPATAMKAIIPMNYTVAEGEPALQVVGNTRGAILASTKIFAGLETPMGINSVGSAVVVPDGSGEAATESDGFNLSAWTPEMFCWEPGRTLPSEIIDGLGYNDSEVVGAYGRARFAAGGSQTVTFNYKSGNHRLNIVGVDLTDDDGNVVASDYHFGYTGTQKQDNIYTLNVPAAGVYTIRYFIEIKSETITSSGNIVFSGDVTHETPASDDFDHSEGFKLNAWTADMFGWQPDADTPAGIINLGYTANQIRAAYGPARFAASGSQTVTFTYKGGTHRLNIVGVDVVDAAGKVAASDYHFGYTGTQKQDNVYTLNIPAAGIYTIRYFMEVKTETITSNGDITFSGTVTTPTASDAETTVTAVMPENGMDRFWTIMSDRGSDPRYVTEADGGLMGDVSKSDASKWHFMARTDGSWDIINAKTGNYITTGAANNSQLKTSTTAPANGWQLIPSEDPTALIIVNGTTQFNTTTSAHNFQVYNWGSGTNKTDAGCKYYIAEASEGADIFLVDTPITGRWTRNTTLAADKSWRVSAVVGLIAEGQARRSVLAYSERERAVAWRPFTHYNSWYELNINRNNSADYSDQMTIGQCVDVIEQWRKNLKEAQGENVVCFLFDDGWDEFGTWTFNKNFPNGFTEANASAVAMNSGIGAWLGPVGGYGQSGNYRRAYWNGKGGMQLSNPAYYKVFLDAVTMLTSSYDFRMFKFDGISAQFSSVGPDNGTTGEENAEAIIDIEQRVREIKPDIFLNTTVGTWASPFWYQYTDATWRQENDFGKAGPGNDREQWITYRDRLVHQNYVTRSPLCPINTIMTHGFILSSYGAVSKDMSYSSIINELYCAFGCGSSMVELYADYPLLNSIEGGKLWADIAECIRWQNDMADVLPDAHWVGGNPWANNKADVYGWAAWNGRRASLTLRNGTDAQPFTFTLREALDIPDYISTSIVLNPALSHVGELAGLEYGKEIDIDQPITVQMPAYSVFVLKGQDMNPSGITLTEADAAQTPVREGIYDLSGRRLRSASAPGIYIIDGKKTIVR